MSYLALTSGRAALRSNVQGASQSFLFLRCFSTTAVNSTASDHKTDRINYHIKTIMRSTIQHIPEYGFTTDAITAGVLSSGLPPSYTGLITNGPSQLVSFIASEFNTKLRDEVIPSLQSEWEHTNPPIPQKIESCLRHRIEMLIPLVTSGRWHEGLALGAATRPCDAAQHLDELAGIVLRAAGCADDIASRAAVAGVYVAVELHALGGTATGDSKDEGQRFEETWAFLIERVRELEMAAEWRQRSGLGNFVLGLPSGPSPEVVTAATAVVSSLGGAVVSLGAPAARGIIGAIASSVVPTLATWGSMQTVESQKPKNPVNSQSVSNGQTIDDNDDDLMADLPPFEVEKMNDEKKAL